MTNYLIQIYLAGLGIAIMSGALGIFLVWRRMAYFGDSLAHSALLGLALAMLLEFKLTIGVVLMCVIVAILLNTLQKKRILSNDTLLAIIAHFTLALGLLVVLSIETVRADILTFLVGDILSVNKLEVGFLWLGVIVVGAFITLFWQNLLTMTIDEDWARVEGVPVGKLRFIFMLILACVIALAMKIVGVLLVVSLMVIPAATARYFAKTPEQMACISILTGIIAVTIGIASSFWFDIATGPAIVVTAGGLFFITASVSPKAA